jgi:hypothetical protein
LTEEEALEQQKIAEAQIQGQAFESAMQYRHVVELIIKEIDDLLITIGFATKAARSDRKILRKKKAELVTRLAAARAFVLECGLGLISDIPLNPGLLPEEKRIIMPDTPKIEVPEPVVPDVLK